MDKRAFIHTFIIPLVSLLVVGTVCFVVFFILKHPPKDYVETTAVIDRIIETRDYDDTWTHTVMVKYMFNNTEYISELGTYDFTMEVGQSIQILVNPNNPMQIQASDSSFISTIVLIITILCYAGAIAFAAFKFIRRNSVAKAN